MVDKIPPRAMATDHLIITKQLGEQVRRAGDLVDIKCGPEEPLSSYADLLEMARVIAHSYELSFSCEDRHHHR